MHLYYNYNHAEHESQKGGVLWGCLVTSLPKVWPSEKASWKLLLNFVLLIERVGVFGSGFSFFTSKSEIMTYTRKLWLTLRVNCALPLSTRKTLGTYWCKVLIEHTPVGSSTHNYYVLGPKVPKWFVISTHTNRRPYKKSLRSLYHSPVINVLGF